MSFFDDASLAFLPSGGAGKDTKAYSIKPTDGSGDFTFSRGSNLAATRVGPTGLIEKGRENLLLQSNQFDTTWGTSSVTPLSGYADRNGGTDAWLLREDATTSAYWIRQSATSGLSTFSFYAKKKDYDWIQFAQTGDGGNYANFNISNGTLGNANSSFFIDRKIEAAGNGYYRCSVTYTIGSGGYVGIALIRSDVSARYDSYAGDTTKGTYIQDAQLEIGLTSTDYIESGATTGKAGLLEDEPRLDYSGGATCPSLLLEPSRTQLIPYTEYFEGTGWGEVGSLTLTTNTDEVTSPEGLNNAALLTSANATSEQYLSIASLSTTSGQDYTISIIAKKKDFDFIMLKFQGSGGAFSAGSVWFNLSTGVVASEDSGKTGYIKEIVNGWYQCSATATATGTTAGATCRIQLASADSTDAVAGDGSKGTYIFGAGFEQGSYPTSYIPNHSGGSVTRGDDSCSVTGISDLINQTEGTFAMELNYKHNQINTPIFETSKTNSNIYVLTLSDYKMRFWITLSGSNEVVLTTPNVPSEGKHKLAVAYKQNDACFYLDGVLIGTDTNCLIPAVSELYLSKPNADVFEFIHFKERLTNAELAKLTTL